MFFRTLTPKIQQKLATGKAIMLIGPRQVGKTTLILKELKDKEFIFFDGDDPAVREILDTPNTEQLRHLIGEYKIVFIDEAQRINNIGLTLKILTDQFKDVQLWISGSSSFTLAHTLNEPLTGRKWQFELLPISWEEYENKLGFLKAKQQLEQRMLYGFYPEVLNSIGNEIDVLKNLTDSYLYKDILSYAEIRKPEVLEKLLKCLAYQVGAEVNLNELSQQVGIDKNTVKRYINILEKGYVIFQLSSFSRNLRNEIKRNKKVYFYDNGIRNMVIKNFDPLAIRQDIGALWENFLLAERIKQINYKLPLGQSFFWRTSKQQEIDYVEQNGGKVIAYEFKWNPKRKAKIPKTFLENYNAEGKKINSKNFREFVIA